jgi:hypothetical protein
MPHCELLFMFEEFMGGNKNLDGISLFSLLLVMFNCS